MRDQANFWEAAFMVALHGQLVRAPNANAAKDAAVYADGAVAERAARIAKWRKDEEAEERHRRG